VIDQLLEILENTGGIYSAFILDSNNELFTINEEKFNNDPLQVEFIDILLPAVQKIMEYESLSIISGSYKYQNHTCNMYFYKEHTLAILLKETDEFDAIEPVIKEILESI
jgi:hypothetical protein